MCGGQWIKVAWRLEEVLQLARILAAALQVVAAGGMPLKQEQRRRRTSRVSHSSGGHACGDGDAMLAMVVLQEW